VPESDWLLVEELAFYLEVALDLVSDWL